MTLNRLAEAKRQLEAARYYAPDSSWCRDSLAAALEHLIAHIEAVASTPNPTTTPAPKGDE